MAETAVTTYTYRTWRVSAGIFFVLVGVLFVFDSAGILRFQPGLLWPLFLVALAAGLLLRRARRLQVEEDRSAQLAVAEERVRIARELHDIVAHGVSLMTIQIAAARRVGATKPDDAREALEGAERTGRQTLSELETMLAVLRGADASIGAAGRPGPGATAPGTAGPGPVRSPLPRLADVPTLIDALRQADRTVSFNVLGDPPQVPPSVEVVVYRVIQEALTNVLKHAGQARTAVRIEYRPDELRITVSDDGRPAGAGPPPVQPHGQGGRGLLGLRERIAIYRGELDAGPRPGGGWRVSATIPLEPAADATEGLRPRFQAAPS